MEDLNKNNKDVGFLEDAIFLLQHLVAAENHAVNSHAKTKEIKYLDMAEFIRKKRSLLLYRLVPESEAEIYCISKHTLGAAQGYKELSSRAKTNENIKEAEEWAQDARDLEALFILMTSSQKEVEDVRQEIIPSTKTKSRKVQNKN